MSAQGKRAWRTPTPINGPCPAPSGQGLSVYALRCVPLSRTVACQTLRIPPASIDPAAGSGLRLGFPNRSQRDAGGRLDLR